MLRDVLLTLSRNQQVRELITAAPVTRDVVKRYIAGDEMSDVLGVAKALSAEGLHVTIDRLGEDVTDEQQTFETATAYEVLFAEIGRLGLGKSVEASLKLSALGQGLGEGGEQLAFENARRICQAAANIGSSVTLDMEDHTTTDSTLNLLQRLRLDFPFVGAVLQAYLYRTEDDVRNLARDGMRIRLCKGAYKEPETVAYQAKLDVDLSYVRCMKHLIKSDAYPMFATHDPRMIQIAKMLTDQAGRSRSSYEFQMLHGIRPDEQRTLVAEGYRTRVYLPYGSDWYGYFMRRLAERPANLAFFARSLLTKD